MTRDFNLIFNEDHFNAFSNVYMIIEQYFGEFVKESFVVWCHLLFRKLQWADMSSRPRDINHLPDAYQKLWSPLTSHYKTTNFCCSNENELLRDGKRDRCCKVSQTDGCHNRLYDAPCWLIAVKTISRPVASQQQYFFLSTTCRNQILKPKLLELPAALSQNTGSSV